LRRNFQQRFLAKFHACILNPTFANFWLIFAVFQDFFEENISMERPSETQIAKHSSVSTSMAVQTNI